MLHVTTSMSMSQTHTVAPASVGRLATSRILTTFRLPWMIPFSLCVLRCLLACYLGASLSSDTTHWPSHVERSATLMIGSICVLIGPPHHLCFIQAIVALICVLRDRIDSWAPHVTTFPLIAIHVKRNNAKWKCLNLFITFSLFLS